jgi:hypothetical protein
MRIEAVSNDGLRRNEAQVFLNVEDINDHTPEFKNHVCNFIFSESNFTFLFIETVFNVLIY